MYTKINNGRQVFSDCKTIQTNDGVWISNPSADQIAAAGWVLYVPPVVPPAPQTEPELEQVMAAVKKMLAPDVANLSDEDALAVASIFPTWAGKLKEAEEKGKGVVAGERLWYNTKLYKVNQPHVPQLDWTPDAVPALFTEISIAEWPAYVQPTGAQDAYNQGDQVSHNDKHWTSDVNGNVWEPGVYGWTEVPQTA